MLTSTKVGPGSLDIKCMGRDTIVIRSQKEISIIREDKIVWTQQLSAEYAHVGKQGCFVVDKNAKSVTKIIYD
jgi:hypothetical protein